jgi:SAM-dependent methyltransferase
LSGAEARQAAAAAQARDLSKGARPADIAPLIAQKQAAQSAFVGNYINEDSDLLDVGCGTGALVNTFQCRATGIESSKEMVRLASKRYPDVLFKVGDAENTALFSSSQFSVIYCLNNTLFYMKRKELFFYNAKQWLKPGGILICTTKLEKAGARSTVKSNLALKTSWDGTKRRRDRITLPGGATYQINHTFYDEPPDTLMQMAKQAGFKWLRSEEVRDVGSLSVWTPLPF